MEAGNHTKNSLSAVRVDKWLWAARFFKTRSLASQAVAAGHVQVAEERIKPARTLRVGERVDLVLPDGPRTVIVLALSDVRGPASVARLLYEETPDSVAAREKRQEDRRLLQDPAAGIAGRPTKADRRQLDRWRG